MTEAAPVDMALVALDLVQKKKWAIFPVHTPGLDCLCTCGNLKCSSPGKHPRTQNGLKDRSSDPEVVRKWWARLSNANIGIPTGHTNNIIVLDVDPRHGGNESLAKLKRKYGDLPVTFAVKTGGGGYHFYFTRFTKPNIKTAVNALGEEYPGIDVRGEGGFVVGPGSLHVSGRRYEPNDTDLVDMPKWLEALLVSPHEKTGTDKKPVSFKIPDKIMAGARNDTLYRTACSLAGKGLSDDAVMAAVREENRVKCSLPLDDVELQTIVNSACSFVRDNPPATPQVKAVAPPPDSEMQRKALDALQGGDPASYFLEQYRRLHAGDEFIMRLLLLVGCCQQCDHSFGIHPALDGVKGSGKSNAVAKALFLFPLEYIYTGTFSAKAFTMLD